MRLIELNPYASLSIKLNSYVFYNNVFYNTTEWKKQLVSDGVKSVTINQYIKYKCY